MANIFKFMIYLVAKVVGFSVWFIVTCWVYMAYMVIAVIAVAFLNS